MKAKVSCVVILLTGFFCVASLNAQTIDPLDFFPHHEGDIWEYYEFDQGIIIDTIQSKFLSDSLGLDGQFYIKASEFGDYVVNPSTLEVYGVVAAIDSVLLYKLDADSGETWIGFRNNLGAIKVEVIDVFNDIIFNEYRVVKFFSYTDSASGFWLGNSLLANGLGRVREDRDLAIPAFLIKGAIIDSVQYGTVTAIKEPSPIYLPQNAVLYQNYPNPFNPSTTFAFALPESAPVRLTIFDLNGRRVAELLNRELPAGRYEIPFDASNLASGVYLYRLSAGSFTQIRKMMLMK
jgi:hypothetical protein